jgi:hypothetical protein
VRPWWRRCGGWRSAWEVGVASVASPSPVLAVQVAGSGGGGWRGGWRHVVASADRIWLEGAGFDNGGCGRARWRLWEGWRSAWEAGVASVASLSPLLAAQVVGSRSDGPLNGARLAEAVTVNRGVAWEAKWPRLLHQPPRGGSGHARQWLRTAASAVVRRPTAWMAKAAR